VFHILPLTQKVPVFGRDFSVSLYVCYCILVPALTGKVKVVTIKICTVKFHFVFVCDVNVRVKMVLSIENFIFLKIEGVNRIKFG